MTWCWGRHRASLTAPMVDECAFTRGSSPTLYKRSRSEACRHTQSRIPRVDAQTAPRVSYDAKGAGGGAPSAPRGLDEMMNPETGEDDVHP